LLRPLSREGPPEMTGGEETQVKTGKVQPFALSVRNSGDESAKKSEKHRLFKKTGMGFFKKSGVFWRALIYIRFAQTPYANPHAQVAASV